VFFGSVSCLAVCSRDESGVENLSCSLAQFVRLSENVLKSLSFLTFKATTATVEIIKCLDFGNFSNYCSKKPKEKRFFLLNE